MAFDFPSSPAVGQVYNPAGGPSWQWDGVAWTSYQSGNEMAINRIFVPGVQGSAVNYTYNKPENLRYLEIEGVSGGGSGASALATTASVWSHGSAGGGGSWGRKLFSAEVLPASFAAVIGAPGAASSSGSGNTAADTTVSVPGMGLTLPGGLRGIQGANVAYTSIATSTASSITAQPTGWDVYRAGESGDSTTVSLVGGGSSTWAIGGRAGSSPWGVGGGSYHGTGWGSTSGYGYGWGSGGSVNAGSAALRNSVAAGPGALMFTEHLAVAPPDTFSATFTPRGDCYLDTPASASALTLIRQNGRHLFINGANEVIPAAGVTLAPTGLSNGIWWIYAAMVAGVMTLEASTTQPVNDATYGIRVKSGDASRTFVGLCWLTTTGTAWSQRVLDTASQYNPKPKTGNGNYSSPTTTSTGIVELSTAQRCYFSNIAGRDVTIRATGTIYAGLATADANTGIGLNGSNILPAFITSRNVQTAATCQTVFHLSKGTIPGTEGNHFASLLGAVSASNTGTWANSWTEVTIFG